MISLVAFKDEIPSDLGTEVGEFFSTDTFVPFKLRHETILVKSKYVKRKKGREEIKELERKECPKGIKNVHSKYLETM